MPREVVIIPARMGSSRFVGKPLAVLCGQSLIARTWRIACAVPGVAQVVVASEDARICEHVHALGGEAMLTPAAAANGTERVAYVAERLAIPPDAIVNLQGDAVLTPPAAVRAALDGLHHVHAHGPVQAATLAVPLMGADFADYAAAKATGQSSGTTVVCNLQGDALYFSKLTLPHLREPPQSGALAWRHLGLYAYRAQALQRYARLAPTPLEAIEGLEQLRWLEHGERMRVVPFDLGGRAVWSIDYPQDLDVAAQIIARQGELLCDLSSPATA